MFSCRHLSDFLSNDKSGKQSALSKRGQEATSNEGSPMAKPRPAFPAQARPMNLVMRSARSEEDSSKSLGYLVNPWNTDERKEVEVAAENIWGSATISEIGYSEASRQEKAPMAPGNSWHMSNSENKVMRDTGCFFIGPCVFGVTGAKRFHN